MTRQQLQLALRAALAARRVPLISELLAVHGRSTFAAALAGCSPRTVADVLTLLRAAERDALLRELPRGLRSELRALGVGLAPGLPAWVRSGPQSLQWSLGARA